LFSSILLALVPVAGLIAVGSALRATGFIGEAFWPQAERLAYFFLLPALLFHSLAMADLASVQVGGLAAVLTASLFVTAVVMVASRRLIAEEGPAFTSAFQGGLRFNNYVGLTAAGGLLGAKGLVLAAVCNAVIVPVANVLCILAFARYGRTPIPLAGAVRTVATNPLVLSCVLGALFQAAGLTIPPGVEGIFRALGQASLPIGLLCVGAAIEPAAMRGGMRTALAASVVKFAVLPAATAVFCVAFGVLGETGFLAMLFHALPTASSAYILSRQLGGDAPLMAGIIAFETLLAAVTMPLTLLAASRWLLA
jgi:malonate transporter